MSRLTFTTQLKFELVPRSEKIVLTSPLVSLTRLYPPRRRIYEIIVPSGFVCDLASVPQYLRSLAPPWNLSARAGVLHDYLYRTGGFMGGPNFDLLFGMSRAKADELFHWGLQADGVGWLRSWAMWLAVRAFADDPWRRYRRRDRLPKLKAL